MAHELVHHHQNLRGDLSPEKIGNITPTYAQDNEHMRNMEKEAYLVGNIMFRDWEDSYKNTHLNIQLKESKNMYKLTEEERRVLKKFSLIREQKETNNIAEEENAFAPNHYCVHHGGVEHNGSIEMAEAVGHNYNKELGRVTHYNMKLSDGTILENVAAEDIQVTDASLAEGHPGHSTGGCPGSDEEPEAITVVVQEDDVEEDMAYSRDDDITENADGAGGAEEGSDCPEGKKIHKGHEDKGCQDVNWLPDTASEGKIVNPEDWENLRLETTEGENKLYEARFGSRNTKLFEKLTKKWTN